MVDAFLTKAMTTQTSIPFSLGQEKNFEILTKTKVIKTKISPFLSSTSCGDQLFRASGEEATVVQRV